jgi:hypothetical protein
MENPLGVSVATESLNTQLPVGCCGASGGADGCGKVGRWVPS